MFKLGSPYRGNSNEYTQYIIFNIKKKITLSYPKAGAMGYFQGTQERVRNSRGKRVIRFEPLKFYCILNLRYSFGLHISLQYYIK